MRLCILRHGATASNEAHRYIGRATDEPLSETGRRQCREAGVFPQVKKVYVSPLRRARESAALCFPCAQLVEVPGLEEFDFGVFEGRSAVEMADDQAYRAWVESGCVHTCPGGDSRAGFVVRVCDAFERLVDGASRRGEQELVVVAHGGTIMALLSAFADACLEGVAGFDNYFCWQVGPAEGYVATVRSDGTILRIEGVRPWAGVFSHYEA